VCLGSASSLCGHKQQGFDRVEQDSVSHFWFGPIPSARFGYMYRRLVMSWLASSGVVRLLNSS
jgi:hypothetical protein